MGERHTLPSTQAPYRGLFNKFSDWVLHEHGVDVDNVWWCDAAAVDAAASQFVNQASASGQGRSTYENLPSGVVDHGVLARAVCCSHRLAQG